MEDNVRQDSDQNNKFGDIWHCHVYTKDVTNHEPPLLKQFRICFTAIRSSYKEINRYVESRVKLWVFFKTQQVTTVCVNDDTFCYALVEMSTRWQLTVLYKGHC